MTNDSTNKTNLPDMVFGRSINSIVIIKRNDVGYYAIEEWSLLNSIPRELNLEQRIDYLNERIGVTKAQRQAMEFGSRFGWHLPMANPDNYDENGIIIRDKLKKH